MPKITVHRPRATVLKHLVLPAAVLLTLWSAPCAAADTGCPQYYVQGMAPDILNPAMTVKARELCFAAYGLVHSGVTRTPLWSAEYLTPARIRSAEDQVRTSSFRVEQRLPEDERAELDDYKGSGYDRGHLTPSGDMPDPAEQRESFSLANVVPQAPLVNRGVWASIEQAVRREVLGGRNLYVITGPMFEGAQLEQLNERVLVPSSLFKAVYDPRSRRAGAYVVDNRKSARARTYAVISIAELERRLGINLFPGLTPAVKNRRADLPKAEYSRHR